MHMCLMAMCIDTLVTSSVGELRVKVLNKPNLKYLGVTSVVFFVKLLDHQGFDRYEVKIEKLEFF